MNTALNDIEERIRFAIHLSNNLSSVCQSYREGLTRDAAFDDLLAHLLYVEKNIFVYLSQEDPLSIVDGSELWPSRPVGQGQKDTLLLVQERVNDLFGELKNIPVEDLPCRRDEHMRQSILCVLEMYYRTLASGREHDYLVLAEIMPSVAGRCARLFGCRVEMASDLTLQAVHDHVVAEDEQASGTASRYARFRPIVEDAMPVYERYWQLQCKAAALEAIVNHRRPKREGDDRLQTYAPFRKSDYREAQIVLAGCDAWEKNDLKNRYDYFSSVGQLLDFVLRMTIPDSDYTRLAPENRPVEDLLAEYTNKKSGRVSCARAELLRRYDYLTTSEQRLIRLALLQAPGKTDLEKGLRLSMVRWDGAEEPLVEQIWQRGRSANEYDLWYWSSRLLLRHAPLSFIEAQQDALTRGEKGGRNASLYYHLCLRMVEQEDFQVDKEQLRVGEYYRLVYHVHLPFDNDEWLQDLYAATAEIYHFSLSNGRAGRRLTKAGEVFPNYAPEVIKIPGERSNEKYLWMRLSDIGSIRDLLLYGSLLGATGVHEYLAYSNMLDDRLAELDEEDVILNHRAYRPTEFWEEKPTDTIRSIELMRECCPEEYRPLFDRMDLCPADEYPELRRMEDILEANCDEPPCPF